MGIIEASKHYPNHARTRCMLDDERWPCATWREALQQEYVAAALPEHAFLWSDHCAECAINRPGRV